ncbi:MAG: right-handed parallel beta-helix repeat-containing protein, partial [Planctomycetota bacterium]
MGIRVCGLLAVCAGVAIASGVEAGPLTPPGAPSSSYKTLVDVEPRTALYATGAGIVISQEGSYYLAENVPAYALQSAIEIQAPNVTLDLNGFTITGSTEVGVDHGIAIASSASNATIYNGTIRDCNAGIIGTNADHVTVRDVRVIDTQSSHGIVLDNNAMVIDCHIENVPGDGIGI